MLLRQALSDERAAHGAALEVLPSTPTKAQIEAFEQMLLQVESECGLTIETRHFFTPGVYAREVFIPAGMVLTGAEHKTEHLVTFVGDISVWHEGAVVRLTGYQTLRSSAGAKRVGFAHADTWCIGFFPNPDDCTDLRELERRFVCNPERLQCNRKPELPDGKPFEEILSCSESLQLPQR